jgi:hypothetical protein
MVVDSQQRWKCVEAVPAFLFKLEGVSAVRAPDASRRGWLTHAEGTVSEISDGSLVVGGDVTLTHTLPASISLSALDGACVQLSLSEEVSPSGPRAQTLVIAERRGARGVAIPRLVARYGPAGLLHGIGRGALVRAALSQRPGGPMTFGTDKLQYVVHVGQHVRAGGGRGDEGGEFVMHFEARTKFDYVAYAIVDRALWARRGAR